MKHPDLGIKILPFPMQLNEQGINERTSAVEDNLWEADKPVGKDNQFFPFSVRRNNTDDDFYTLPYEPLIHITGSNKLIKRSVSKSKNLIGTIKEWWSQDDYKIRITGSLIGQQMIGDASRTYPREAFERLRDYCTSPEGLEVQCEPLQLLGINHIVVEDFDFPFTKGENVQAYEMVALSDFAIDFLLEIE